MCKKNIVYIFLLLITINGCHKKHKTIIVKNLDGSIKEKYEVLLNDTNTRDGYYESFYMDDKIYLKESYKNGKLNGSSRMFYFNPNVLYSEYIYDRGLLNGKYVIYNNNSELVEKGEYVNDKLYNVEYYNITNQQRTLSTFKNGKGVLLDISVLNREVKSVSSYRNGLMDGYSISFSQYGLVDAIGKYSLGAKVDTWFYSHKQPYIDSVEIYSKGNLDKSFKLDTPLFSSSFLYRNSELDKETVKQLLGD